MSNNLPVLSVRNLSKHFGEGCDACLDTTGPEHGSNVCPHCGTVVACEDISFDLFPNEVLGIVGESGSGKSTVVRLLNTDWEATTGSVYTTLCPETDSIRTVREDPLDLLQLNSFQQRQIRNSLLGVVYQHPHLGLRMNISAGGNVAERLLMAGWRNVDQMRNRTGNLLDRTEVSSARMDELPKNFSGGMQQRVQIAKALSNKPRLLLFDEITTGLDVSVQARVLDLIRTLVSEMEVATIVVSHDLGVIRMLTSRTMAMKDGRIVESGLTDQILEDPQHPYTQLLVSSVL